MPFLDIFKSFSPKPHKRKHTETYRSPYVQAHRNYGVHERTQVPDDMKLDTRNPQHWHTAGSLLDDHKSTTSHDQHTDGASHKLTYHFNHPETSRSWSPIPSVHRYLAQNDSISNSSESSERFVNMWRHVIDTRETFPNREGNQDTYIPVARSVYSGGIHDRTPEDGWYREEMDRRERFGNSDTHLTMETKRVPPYQNRAGTSLNGKNSDTNAGHLSNIRPTIYQHEVWNIGDSEPDLYHYIVPGGMNVIFKDEGGNEVSRVGHFGKSVKGPRRVSPTIVQDEYGNELYRTGDFGRLLRYRGDSDNGHVGPNKNQSNYPHFSPSISTKIESSISYASVPSDATNVILIDDHGHQVPIRSARRSAGSHVPSGGSRAYI